MRGRDSNRVFFEAPVRLRGFCRQFDANVVDISVSGLRLRVRRDAVDLARTAGIGLAGTCIQNVLGPTFTAALESPQGHGQVMKRLLLVRLALRDDESGAIDLGCHFESPLTPSQVRTLGLVLPELEAPAGSVRRPAAFPGEDRWPAKQAALDATSLDLRAEAVPEPEAPQSPRRPLRAVVATGSAGGVEPLVCHAESFTLHTVLVRARGEMLPYARSRGVRDAAAAAVEFTDHYGDQVDLELVEGVRSVWRGRTRVCGVEVDPERQRDILLRLAFGRPLQMVEFGRLRDGGSARDN